METDWLDLSRLLELIVLALESLKRVFDFLNGQ